MNWEQLQGDWTKFRGQVKEQWGKLTDDDLDVIEGRREQLIGRIQKAYGIQKEKADREVDDWFNALK
jgi:uncharacterized protein YjbJ (UPF0337 family)